MICVWYNMYVYILNNIAGTGAKVRPVRRLTNATTLLTRDQNPNQTQSIYSVCYRRASILAHLAQPINIASTSQVTPCTARINTAWSNTTPAQSPSNRRPAYKQQKYAIPDAKRENKAFSVQLTFNMSIRCTNTNEKHTWTKPVCSTVFIKHMCTVQRNGRCLCWGIVCLLAGRQSVKLSLACGRWLRHK